MSEAPVTPLLFVLMALGRNMDLDAASSSFNAIAASSSARWLANVLLDVSIFRTPGVGCVRAPILFRQNFCFAEYWDPAA